MQQVDDQTFRSVVEQGEGKILVDFSASWCGPCKMMLPILDQLSNELAGQVKIVKVDIEEAHQTTAKYGIRSIPCFILFSGGIEISRLNGYQSKTKLTSFLGAKPKKEELTHGAIRA